MNNKKINILTVENIHLSFALPVLRGVSLNLDEGEIVSVVGPSGCGKSTLLRCIAGLQQIDKGNISIRGIDVTHVPAYKRSVSMVFQDGQLFPHMNVAKNIAFPMRKISSKEKRQRVRELLELVDLSGFEKRGIDTLSGGQASRVALARSLARGGDVLLCDEPLAALDVALRMSLSLSIRKIVKNAGASCVYVTHDGEEAKRVGDKVVRMDEGVLHPMQLK
ncbi:MAG: ABC transporter ATP-binding protein [Actinomycetaceae bacterium]|nr:ABC transporter ATP-binding protein [Actinomycetaceae bacterium]